MKFAASLSYHLLDRFSRSLRAFLYVLGPFLNLIWFMLTFISSHVGMKCSALRSCIKDSIILKTISIVKYLHNLFPPRPDLYVSCKLCERASPNETISTR